VNWVITTYPIKYRASIYPETIKLISHKLPSTINLVVLIICNSEMLSQIRLLETNAFINGGRLLQLYRIMNSHLIDEDDMI
jgi:hypothetical protein